MRLNQRPVLRLCGRYFNAASMWRELSLSLGSHVMNADALFDVLTDPFEYVADLTVSWQLPHTPLTVHEHKLLAVLLDVAALRDDLKLDFPNPPRWLARSAQTRFGT